MVSVYDIYRDTPARLLVQVHDELVVIVPEDSVEQFEPLLVKAMGDGTVVNGIPLKVSCHSAHSWSEAKGK
jgi:DNA polymerase I-like protein with 3'-5' exonuclease and polymerase domains